MKETNPIERTSMFWASNDASWHTPETLAAVADLSLNTLTNWRAQGRGRILEQLSPYCKGFVALSQPANTPRYPTNYYEFAYELTMRKAAL